jgi:hypothetical protein
VHVGGFRVKLPKSYTDIYGGRGYLAPESTNVHAFAYDFNWNDPSNGTLKVRFHSKSGSGPGPQYNYRVPPSTFISMVEANSKGGFVWDDLIRAHVPVKLGGVEVVNGEVYVPRQVNYENGRAYFDARTIRGKSQKTGKRSTHRSSLPSAEAGSPWSALASTAPERGKPNRGEPYRGR